MGADGRGERGAEERGAGQRIRDEDCMGRAPELALRDPGTQALDFAPLPGCRK